MAQDKAVCSECGRAYPAQETAERKLYKAILKDISRYTKKDLIVGGNYKIAVFLGVAEQATVDGQTEGIDFEQFDIVPVDLPKYVAVGLVDAK